MDFEIGKIANTHGLMGHIKVFPTTDDPSRFSKLKQIFVIQKGVPIIYTLQSVRQHKNIVILKLYEINTIEEAQLLKGATIKIPKELALPLQSDEYYIKDLYDLNVFTEENENLGTVKDVIQTSANDVYVVQNENGREILIPAIKQCILNVDIKNKKIIVKLLKGLL